MKSSRLSSRTRGAKAGPLVKTEPKPPFPRQHQRAPGLESKITPLPQWRAPRYRPAAKLENKVALITGGDSGIGRSVAFLYAKEGADVAISYLPREQSDAEVVRAAVEALGRRCLLLPADLTTAKACNQIVAKTLEAFGKLDVLVSNAAHQVHTESLTEVTEEQFDLTYKTNVYAYFRLVKAALPHLKPGAAIIVTSSVTGILGTEGLPDYSSTKGAINALTKTLAMDLIKRGIRVNAVAPGPVWTPLNPSDAGRTSADTAKFGAESPMGRPAQPEELSPAYVFLASDADSSYITGTVLQVMGRRNGRRISPVEVHVGCSGWFYSHWRGVFYPKQEVSTKLWFAYYANVFRTVELNAPFYRWPKPATVKRWQREGPPGFRYSVKANRSITHERKLVGTKKLVASYYEIGDMLAQKGQMGCFLFQFPPSFHFRASRLKAIVTQLSARHPTAVEFRHKSWWIPEVYRTLKQHGLIFCAVSAPRLPEVLPPAGDKIYVRLHGTTQWYRHDYTDEQLAEWAQKILTSGAQEAWVYFDNDRNGYAIKNALRFRRMIRAQLEPGTAQSATHRTI